MDASLTRRMIEAARQIQGQTGAYWTDQLNNASQLSAYHAMGQEIVVQTGGSVDAYVQSVGTAASLRGVAEHLRGVNPVVRIVAVEPAESAVLSGGTPGVHKIEGVGAGFVVPLWDPSVVSSIARVSTDDAKAMARRLAREEGLMGGTSTGANIVAALKTARELGSDKTVVTVLCDTGAKYLSTDLYRSPAAAKG